MVGCDEQRWGPRPELQAQAWPLAWSVTRSLDLGFPTNEMREWTIRCFKPASGDSCRHHELFFFFFFLVLFNLNAFIFVYNFIFEQKIHSQSSEFERHIRVCSEVPTLPIPSLPPQRQPLFEIFCVSFQKIYVHMCVFSPSHLPHPCFFAQIVPYSAHFSCSFSHIKLKSLESIVCSSGVLIPFVMAA